MICFQQREILLLPKYFFGFLQHPILCLRSKVTAEYGSEKIFSQQFLFLADIPMRIMRYTFLPVLPLHTIDGKSQRAIALIKGFKIPIIENSAPHAACAHKYIGNLSNILFRTFRSHAFQKVLCTVPYI